VRLENVTRICRGEPPLYFRNRQVLDALAGVPGATLHMRTTVLFEAVAMVNGTISVGSVARGSL
jgi:hypothetical protein